MTMVTTHVPAKYNQELESAMSYDAPDLAFSTLFLLLNNCNISHHNQDYQTQFIQYKVPHITHAKSLGLIRAFEKIHFHGRRRRFTDVGAP